MIIATNQADLDELIQTLLGLQVTDRNVESVSSASEYLLLMKKIMDDITKGAREKTSVDLVNIMKNGIYEIRGPVGAKSHFSESVSLKLQNNEIKRIKRKTFGLGKD